MTTTNTGEVPAVRQQASPSEININVAGNRPAVSFKQRLAKYGAIGLAGAVAYGFIADRIPHLPNPIGAIAETLGDAWDTIGGAAEGSKEAVDEAVHDFTGRSEEPLAVDAEDVVRGQVEGRVSYGQVERVYEIKYAEKKYNSWVPRGDEWVRLYDAEYVGEASVPGPAEISSVGNTIDIRLRRPQRDPDIDVRRSPRVDDDPQIMAEAGQIPGDETDTGAALEELEAYANTLEREDEELMDAASCWAILSVEGVVAPALEAAGFEVVTGTEAGIDNNPDNHIVLNIRAEAYRQGENGPSSFYDAKSCASILDDTRTDQSGEGPLQLPTQTVEEVKLKQEG